MEPSDELKRKAKANQPFPSSRSTLKNGEEQASLDDPRLADRGLGSSLPDQEIAGRALRALAKDSRVSPDDGFYDRITVQIESRVATISGVVDSASQRMAAEELVEGIPGVVSIQNAVTVAVDNHLSDKDLDHLVREKLDQSGLQWVGSKVNHGIVRLVGTTDSLPVTERAVKVAGSVRGIRDVVDNVKIKAPEDLDRLDLQSLVTRTLAANDLVLLDKEVRVNEGIVRISGKVRSLKDRRTLRRVVADIAGVRGIRDKLEVDPALFRDWQARTQLSSGR